MWAYHCNIGTALEAADLSWDGLGIIAPGFAWLTASSVNRTGHRQTGIAIQPPIFDLERRLIDVYGPTGFAL
jgi:hypothetical protein